MVTVSRQYLEDLQKSLREYSTISIESSSSGYSLKQGFRGFAEFINSWRGHYGITRRWYLKNLK